MPQKYNINNKIIEADMSYELAEHLKSFPAEYQPDLIISNYDKYISFLYNKRNGFKDPDLVAWMDSQERLEEATQLALGSPNEIKIILDLKALNPGVLASLFSSHITYGLLSPASSLNVKGRLRLAELSSKLLSACSPIQKNNTNYWILISCKTSL
jgi:hypothetical protein